MADKIVGVRRHTTGTKKTPNKVTGLASSNLAQNTYTLTWTAATIPSGGGPVLSYAIFMDSVQRKTVVPPVGSTVVPTTTDLQSLATGSTHLWQVQGINLQGPGTISDTLSVTMVGAGAEPGPASAFVKVGVEGTNTVAVDWAAATPNAIAGLTGYRIYATGLTDPVLETTDGGTATAGTAAGLSPGTSYTLTIVSYNAVGESTGVTLSVTTAPDTGSGQVSIWAEALRRKAGVTTHASFANSIYSGIGGDTTYTDALSNQMIASNMSIFRERIYETNASQRRALVDMINAGMRWHATIGALDGTSANFNDADMRAVARPEVTRCINELYNYYRPLSPTGDIADFVCSINGPNEIEKPATGPLWDNHARVWQEEIWNQIRPGHANSHLHAAAFNNVPIGPASMRSNITLQEAKNYADPTGNVQTNGRYWLWDYCDHGNEHQYLDGKDPTVKMGTVYQTLETYYPKTDNYPGCLSETGYLNAGWADDGTYQGVQTGGGNQSVPEWVEATYMPRMLFTANRMPTSPECISYEFLDDPDRGRLDIESSFGMIAMPVRTGWVASPIDQNSLGPGSVAGINANPPNVWRRKPSYHAWRRLLGLMKDEAAVPSILADTVPTPLSFSVGSGSTAAGVNFQKRLMRKTNGHWLLAIWRDVSPWNTALTTQTNGGPVTISNVDIDITFTQARTINVYQPNDATNASKLGSTTYPAPVIQGPTTLSAGGTITVALGQNMKILDIV